MYRRYYHVMKQKALDTLQASQILINNNLFTASIHSSYYAVLQYMKYMLAHTSNRPISYEEQAKDGGDTHKFVLNEIKDRISNPRNRVSFAEGFRNLKKARVNADYTLEEFNDEDSTGYRQKAVGLIFNLKTYFGNL